MVRVAVIGATGAVGRIMLEDLEASSVRDLDVSLFASPRSEGMQLDFRGRKLAVSGFDPATFPKVDYCLMSAGSAFSLEHSEALVGCGSYVIDNSSAWRMHPGVPLVIPEVNGHELKKLGTSACIVANPNCSTIQMLVAVAPVAEVYGLEEIHVATYQSASGAGQKGIDALQAQLKQSADGQTAEILSPLPAVLAGNLIPAIDILSEDGHCKEEIKMIQESRKILGRPELSVFATTVRVPVERGHSEAVHLRLTRPALREELIKIWEDASGVEYLDSLSYKSLPQPSLCLHRIPVLVGRVRVEHGRERSSQVQFWNVADNLKKGAASNAVQIFESLHQQVPY